MTAIHDSTTCDAHWPSIISFQTLAHYL